MNLEPIQDYVELRTNLCNGEDLFVYSIPDNVSKGVLILQETAGNTVHYETPGIYEGRFQVIVRDSDYASASERAWELFSLLNMIETNLVSYVVTYCRPRHTPYPFQRSAGDLIEVSINYDLRYREL